MRRGGTRTRETGSALVRRRADGRTYFHPAQPDNICLPRSRLPHDL